MIFFLIIIEDHASPILLRIESKNRERWNVDPHGLTSKPRIEADSLATHIQPLNGFRPQIENNAPIFNKLGRDNGPWYRSIYQKVGREAVVDNPIVDSADEIGL